MSSKGISGSFCDIIKLRCRPVSVPWTDRLETRTVPQRHKVSEFNSSDGQNFKIRAS
jgi:hypothetical protein